MARTASPPPDIPMFRLFSDEQLKELTGYSLVYLYDLRTGRQPIRPHFKNVVSRILGMSAEKLFGPDGAEEG